MDRVLIIEDEPLLLWAIEQYLSRRGYKTFSARTGREARRVLEEENVDLVVTDVKLPDTSGLSLLEHIRLRHPAVPLVTITTKPLSAQEATRIQELSHQVLGKPFEMRRLEEAIRLLLSAPPYPEARPGARRPKRDEL